MNGALRPRARLGVFVLAAGLVLAATSRAEDARAPDPRRARVAVRVGEQTFTVGEIEDQLAEMPPFQRRLFGDTLDAQVKAFVEQVVVRDLILAEGARARDLAKTLPTAQHLRRARSSATIRALRRKLPSPAAIPDEDVKRFYEEHRSRFDSPERIHLWRVLTKTKEEAEQVLAAAKKEPTTTKWNELAREHSADKATNLRGGNLGFVSADGTSNEAGVAVDPALVRAAQTVKDGELVPQPVPENDHFAVVWRRGTVPASKRTLEEASAQIRTTLYRERTESAEKDLVAALRAAHVRDVNVDLLSIIDLGGMDAGFMAPRILGRPGPGASPASSPR